MPTIQVHPIKFMKQYIHPTPTLWSPDMHLNGTLNTKQCCRLCKGIISSGTIAINSRVNKTLSVTKCWLCGGKKEMSNRELSEGEQLEH